jgi:uncharacterized SAM-binding protein YcdF (DUF218 family)
MSVTYVEPALPFLLLLGLAGVVRAWRSSGNRRPWLETIALGGITFLSINAGAWLLSRPLESGYSVSPMPEEHADAIVVLSGTVHPPVPGRPYTIPAPDTYRRVQHAVWLFRNWKQIPILVSGGGTNERPHAAVMRDVLLTEGIPAQMVWTESHSSNTHESALNSSALLRAQGVRRVALVTEAYSMPRAARAFEKAGIAVVPAVSRRTQLSGDYWDVFPGPSAIDRNGEIIHELVGLLWYKLRGWI